MSVFIWGLAANVEQKKPATRQSFIFQCQDITKNKQILYSSNLNENGSKGSVKVRQEIPRVIDKSVTVN